VHYFTQPTLRTDAEAETDQQHPRHQLRIDRGTTRVAVEQGKVPPKIGEIEEPINAAEQMIGRNVRAEVEGLRQSVLVAAVLPHHATAFSLPPESCDRENSCPFRGSSTEQVDFPR